MTKVVGVFVRFFRAPLPEKIEDLDLDIVEEGHLEPLEIGLEPRLFEKYGAKQLCLKEITKLKRISK
jgi:hypothetical protein